MAETRIDERVSRPNMEQCADQANARLASEVEGLHDTLTALREKLELCTQTRAQLVSARASPSTVSRQRNNITTENATQHFSL